MLCHAWRCCATPQRAAAAAAAAAPGFCLHCQADAAHPVGLGAQRFVRIAADDLESILFL
jgi:hypothetical protein